MCVGILISSPEPGAGLGVRSASLWVWNVDLAQNEAIMAHHWTCSLSLLAGPLRGTGTDCTCRSTHATGLSTSGPKVGPHWSLPPLCSRGPAQAPGLDSLEGRPWPFLSPMLRSPALKVPHSLVLALHVLYLILLLLPLISPACPWSPSFNKDEDYSLLPLCVLGGNLLLAMVSSPLWTYVLTLGVAGSKGIFLPRNWVFPVSDI